MVEENIITIIKQLGQFMEAIEGFFLNFFGGYTVLIIGLSVISLVSVIFFYIKKTSDWAVST